MQPARLTIQRLDINIGHFVGFQALGPMVASFPDVLVRSAISRYFDDGSSEEHLKLEMTDPTAITEGMIFRNVASRWRSV